MDDSPYYYAPLKPTHEDVQFHAFIEEQRRRLLELLFVPAHLLRDDDSRSNFRGQRLLPAPDGKEAS